MSDQNLRIIRDLLRPQYLLRIDEYEDTTVVMEMQQAIPLPFDDAKRLHEALGRYLSLGELSINDIVTEWKAARDVSEREQERKELKPVPTKGRPGHVYLIECNGAYKIGIAKNLKARITSMQSGSPLPLTLVHSIKTKSMEVLETELHNRFASKRIDREWFRLGTADVEYIKGLAT